MEQTMRGTKRPRGDDYGPAHRNSSSRRSVGYPNHPTHVVPNPIPDRSLNPSLLITNAPGIGTSSYTTAARLSDHEQYYDYDPLTQFVMEDFVHIDQTAGDASSDGLGDETWTGIYWDHAEQVDTVVTEPTASNPNVNSTHGSQPLPNQIVAPTRGVPEKQEWEKHRQLITFLYGPEEPNLNLTLKEVMAVMKQLRFLEGATSDMYKNRFLEWDVTKNQSHAPRRRRARRQNPPDSTRTSVDLTLSPSLPSQPPLGHPGVSFGDVAKDMRAICLESIKERPNGTWNLDDDLCVLDDDWQDAYGAAANLTLKLHQSPESPEAACPWEAIRDDITPMVQSLNYFSLPTILMIAYLMCKKLGDPKVRHVPACFLGGCLQVSRAESHTSSRHVRLTSLLEGLYNFAKQDNNVEDLLEVLNLTIPCYMQLVSDYGNMEGATALSLLSFYHTQLGTGRFWLERTLEKIMRLLLRVEAAKGPCDKATIEVLGFAILVLSETDQDKRLTVETSKMRQRTKRQLNNLPKDHPDREYYLDRLLDVYHLDMRLASEMGEKEYAKEIREEYEERLRKEGKEKDSFAGIFDLEVESLTSQLEAAGLGE